MKANIITEQGMSGGWTYYLTLEGAGIRSIAPENAYNIKTKEEAERAARKFIAMINNEEIKEEEL